MSYTLLYTLIYIMKLTKKDIIALNQKFEEGNIINEASLDFALSYSNKTTDWIKSLAYLIRAITLDHVFEEANKRTTGLLIKSTVEWKGYKIYDNDITRLVLRVSKKKIINIKPIEEKLKDVIRKKN